MQAQKSTYTRIKLSSPIRYIKGVGPERAKIFLRLGIETLQDLLYLFPRRYEDRRCVSKIANLSAGQKQIVKAEILKKEVIRTRHGINIFRMTVSDKTGIMNCMWFNQPYLDRLFKTGDNLIFYGKVDRDSKFKMVHPEYEFLNNDEDNSVHMERIVPVYPLTQDLTQRFLRPMMKKVLEDQMHVVQEYLPLKLRARLKLADLVFAFRNIHFPENDKALAMAYRRLVFNEFFFMQLGVAQRKKFFTEKVRGIKHSLNGKFYKEFVSLLPFELTGSQRKAVEEISKDMQSEKRMNRLLEGEVGSGKTIVAAHAMVIAIQNGYQVAMMAPTEVLAQQHYINLDSLLEPLGINVAFLAGGIDATQKEKILKELFSGKIDILVGTHALLQEWVKFKDLGLVVVDEQHKFGVFQRSALQEKGAICDILVMTATPIPRTLAMTLYGELDLSVLDELPAGRRQTKTIWVDEQKREEIYDFVRQELKNGRQAFIVYPLVESSKRIEAKAAQDMYHKLKCEVFADFSVGLLHGRMKSNEKNKTMSDFRSGRIDILVSTVVIEVGVDIHNASVMVIENAERFGLAQLHQLRGRIGRGEHDSYCILISEPTTEEAYRRLDVFTQLEDGFKIAEEDLDIRGPGDIFGKKQHGMLELRIGDIIKDAQILKEARREAFELIDKDPELKLYEHRLLKYKFQERFKDTELGLKQVG